MKNPDPNDDRHICHDCGALEGELHKPIGCDMERCPFCGGQLISCGCRYNKFYPDYRFMAEPFSNLPEEVYMNGLPKEQEEEWERDLEAKGRIPYVVYPNMCIRCGALWPDMFSVSDSDWNKYVELEMRGKMLCRKCYDWIKNVVDKAELNKESADG